MDSLLPTCAEPMGAQPGTQEGATCNPALLLGTHTFYFCQVRQAEHGIAYTPAL